MSNSNTPPKPSQPVAPQNTIPPGSNSNPANKPSLTLCTESYEPQLELRGGVDGVDREEKNFAKVK